MNDRGVDRSELAALLSADDTACAMARDALAAGVDFTSPRGTVSAVELMRTYQVRMKLTSARGIATIGMAAAVSALDAAGTSRIAIGSIGSRQHSGWQFVIFVDHDSGHLVSCIGVELQGGR
jgi:hypothetical protein